MSKKNKKTIIKIIFLAIFFSFILSSFFNISIANDASGGIGPGKGDPNVTEIKDIVNKILGILIFIGVVVSVVMITILGANYFTTAHDPEQKAKVNERMKSILLGTVLVFGATAILTAIYKITKSLE